MDSLKEDSICFLDFETTGSNLFIDEPIQIGAFLYDWSNKKKIQFESNIRPSNNITNSKTAFDIHHIDLFQIKEEPTAKEVLTNYFKIMGTNYCFAGWNISFDIPFFRKMCFENSFQEDYDSINYRHIDVQSICKTLKYLGIVDQSLNSLTDFSKFFGISRSKKHRALEDAIITYEIFCKALHLLEETSIEKRNLFIQ